MTIAPIAPIVLAGSEALIVRMGGTAAVSAIAGQLGTVVGTGTGGAIIALGSGAIGGVIGGQVSQTIAKWAEGKITKQDRDNTKDQDIKQDIAFAMLHVRANQQDVADQFFADYPPSNLVVNNRLNVDLSAKKYANVVVARAIGFWGVHVKVKNFDPAYIPQWSHPLKRGNFGVLSFCRDGIPLFEKSIHFSNQLLLEYGLKTMFLENRNYTDYLGEFPNKLYGSLAPTVKAKISFLPVWEVVSMEWARPLERAKTCADKALLAKKDFYAKRGLNLNDLPDYYCVRQCPIWLCNDPSSTDEEPHIAGYTDFGNMC